MPNLEDIDKMETDPANCRSIAYDIVYNGNELGGGSVRIHDGEIQKRVFKALGLNEEETQEIDEKTQSALDLYKYLEENPHLVQAMRDVDVEGFKKLNNFVPDELTKKIKELEEYVLQF